MTARTDVAPPIARAVESFNDHDIDGYVAEFAEEGTFSDPVRPDGLSKGELREYIAELYEAFPDARAEEERVVPSDDGAAVEWTFRGTHEGEFDGIPPTGETIAIPFVSSITVSDDGITSWRDYWDRQTFVEQLGLE